MKKNLIWGNWFLPPEIIPFFALYRGKVWKRMLYWWLNRPNLILSVDIILIPLFKQKDGENIHINSLLIVCHIYCSLKNKSSEKDFPMNYWFKRSLNSRLWVWLLSNLMIQGLISLRFRTLLKFVTTSGPLSPLPEDVLFNHLNWEQDAFKNLVKETSGWCTWIFRTEWGWAECSLLWFES